MTTQRNARRPEGATRCGSTVLACTVEEPSDVLGTACCGSASDGFVVLSLPSSSGSWSSAATIGTSGTPSRACTRSAVLLPRRLETDGRVIIAGVGRRTLVVLPAPCSREASTAIRHRARSRKNVSADRVMLMQVNHSSHADVTKMANASHTMSATLRGCAGHPLTESTAQLLPRLHFAATSHKTQLKRPNQSHTPRSSHAVT